MASLEKQILVKSEPSIALKQMDVMDSEKEDTPAMRKDLMVKRSNIVGDLYPYIEVSNFSFHDKTIVSMSIDESRFIPTVTATVIDKSGAFGSAYFPKTDPVLSLYVKSRNKNYKPIRNDYIITHIFPDTSGDRSQTAEGKENVYTIRGELFIPKLYNSNINSYSGTSIDVLEKIANELDLGFATNEETTSDSMTWLSPAMKYSDLITHITTHAYKDDQSFYMSFIDKYYCLNFINVNEMLSNENDFPRVFHSLVSPSEHLKNDKEQEDNMSSNLLLCNSNTVARSDIFIRELKPITRQGKYLTQNLFRRTIQFYDYTLNESDPSNKEVEFFIEPISEQRKKEEGEPLIPENEDLRTKSTATYLGIDYGNTHTNYKFAQIHNSHNIDEINKIKLQITTVGTNLNITRGMRVPIMIVREGKEEGEMYDARVNEDKPTDIKKLERNINMKVDQFLSDFYVIVGIKFSYDPAEASKDATHFFTEIELAKRDWKKVPEPENF
jgi:hypothetical protein